MIVYMQFIILKRQDFDPLRGHWQVGNSTEVVHLSKGNAGITSDTRGQILGPSQHELLFKYLLRMLKNET